ncbi:transposase [Kurthia sibirica]|nr:transposase [Kurthia sibirica]GEK32684.1 hypothetical protein KSI01_02170 [Kurthia sibirica]
MQKSTTSSIHTLKKGQVEILNSFLEGIHHKTKVLKRNAFGCRRLPESIRPKRTNRKSEVM